MSALVTEVSRLRRHEGWDGEGARPITKQTCQIAGEFLRHIVARVPSAPRPFVSASPTGAISLRWVKGRRGITVRVSAASPGRATYLIGGGGARPIHGETDWGEIGEHLQAFLAND